jgi:glycosyltransferase involved in cell wall biosynthesis
MKIAQVSPLWESVPPKLYGGTERIVSYITEELVRQGHDVTLFASGDSVTDAKLEAPCHQALRLNTGIFNREAPVVSMMEQVFSSAEQFDVIHSHLDFLAFSLSRRCPVPVITTLHGRLDLPELVPVFRDFSELPLISISDSQRRPLPWCNWLGTVYHGLPANLYTAHPEPGKYLAFLGRISPEKCPDQAIELAKRVGMPLRIAAKVDPADRAYFERVVEPLLDHPLVEFVGEVTDGQKNDFIGNAHALVCPYDWPEPFGLVLIEAMACGTPVLAYRRGSIPEVIDHGITGLISDNLAEMAKQVESIPLVDRRGCRQMFEERFTAERMVRNYLQVYHQVLSEPSLFHGQKNRRLALEKAS